MGEGAQRADEGPFFPHGRVLDLPPAAEVLRVGEFPALAGSEVLGAIDFAAFVARRTALGEAHQAHAHAVAWLRFDDGALRVVVHLVVAIDEVDIDARGEVRALEPWADGFDRTPFVTGLQRRHGKGRRSTRHVTQPPT
jgi:hypothetical protein